MKNKVIRLTESELVKLVQKVLQEQTQTNNVKQSSICLTLLV